LILNGLKKVFDNMSLIKMLDW